MYTHGLFLFNPMWNSGHDGRELLTMYACTGVDSINLKVGSQDSC